MKKEVPFIKARQGFRFHNETANHSKRTTDWYDRKLSYFESFLHARYPEKEGEALLIADVKTDDIREFIAFLQARTVRYETHVSRHKQEGPLSPFTIRGFTRCLSAFFTWAYRDHLVSRRLTENVKWPSVPKDIKDIFSREELVRLLKACNEYPEALAARNRAMVLFLLDTGVRAAEFCGMTLSDLDENYHRAKIMGKGLRERFVPIQRETREALWKYVHYYRPSPKIRGEDHVFLSRYGNSLTTGGLATILHDLGVRAGVTSCHPHKFRHTAGTLFHKNSNGNLVLTQQFLGHQSINTTRVYVHTYTEDLERAHEKASPVENWDL